MWGESSQSNQERNARQTALPRPTPTTRNGPACRETPNGRADAAAASETTPTATTRSRPVDPFRRRQRLARSLKAQSLDAFLVSQPVNVTYLSGFRGEASFLVVGRDRSVL